MQLTDHLALGFGTALTAVNVACLVAGMLLGLASALLPRVGPLAVMALLLPCVGALDATSTLVLLAAVCAGASQGRALSSLWRLTGDDDPAGQLWLGARTAGWMGGFASLAAGLLVWLAIVLLALLAVIRKQAPGLWQRLFGTTASGGCSTESKGCGSGCGGCGSTPRKVMLHK